MGGRGSSSPNATGTNVRTRAMAGGASTSQVQVQQGQQTMHGRVRATTDTSGERFGPDVPGRSHAGVVDLQNMTDAQVSNYIKGLHSSISDAELDSHMLDSANKSNWSVTDSSAPDFQRFVYDVGANGRPNVVSRQHFMQMDGDTIYRTVNSSTSVKSETSEVRADRFINGEFFSTGRGFYGQGSYFATTKGASTSYANGTGSSLIRAKLNARANSVRDGALGGMLARESAAIRSAFGGSGSQGFKSESHMSMYALYKGYNIILAANGSVVVLDRSALTVCDDVSNF